MVGAEHCGDGRSYTRPGEAVTLRDAPVAGRRRRAYSRPVTPVPRELAVLPAPGEQRNATTLSRLRAHDGPPAVLRVHTIADSDHDRDSPRRTGVLLPCAGRSSLS